MANRSPWLQPGSAERCARLSAVWGVLTLFAAALAVALVDIPVIGRICEAPGAAAVAAAALAAINYASYRVHARDGI